LPYAWKRVAKEETVKTLQVKTRREWRAWLAKHHKSENEIWLIFFKAHTGQPTVPYADTVEEALCFGWIDSLIKRLDEDRYARKFTPRRSGSVWSEANKRRVEKLLADSLIADAGLVSVNEAKASGEWDCKRTRPLISMTELPFEFGKALEAHPIASRVFNALAPTYQKQYILWITTAKRTDTRQRRTSEAIQKLERGERLGLK
jgi:uncharacterized protein YdeI (YjbR/CyaY-like superfamily)